MLIQPTLEKLSDMRLPGLRHAVEEQLANPQFVERAPDAVVEKERAKAAQLAGRLAKLQAQLEDLG